MWMISLGEKHSNQHTATQITYMCSVDVDEFSKRDTQQTLQHTATQITRTCILDVDEFTGKAARPYESCKNI